MASSLVPLAIVFFVICFMFLQFLATYFLSNNFIVTIMSILSLIPLAILLRGHVKDGLYVLPTDAHAVTSFPKQAHIGERTSS